jgi:hypothetical protein
MIVELGTQDPWHFQKALCCLCKKEYFDRLCDKTSDSGGQSKNKTGLQFGLRVLLTYSGTMYKNFRSIAPANGRLISHDHCYR